VRAVEPGGTLRAAPVAVLNVDAERSETGLLGIALHPRFERGDPWIYLYLSDPASGMNRIVRLRADEGTSDPEVLLETVPATNAYHNGGDLLFGPDGMLYASVGEAHETARAQDPADPGGKVLRLTPQGTAAPGNPFGEGVAAFTLGHRNSFGLCLDPATGQIWETENGPDRDDEVNRLEAGGNYGWPVVLGPDGDGRFVDPVAVLPDPVALTGCAWWDGSLYVGSYNDGRVRRVDVGSGDMAVFARFGAGVTDLQVGPDGWLYVATANAIWRIAPGTEATDGPGEEIDEATSIPARTWVALGAAVVLAVALVVRIAAGRRLRRAAAEDPPDGAPDAAG
jgi:glucose/arabinose dehydrogenase